MVKCNLSHSKQFMYSANTSPEDIRDAREKRVINHQWQYGVFLKDLQQGKISREQAIVKIRRWMEEEIGTEFSCNLITGLMSGQVALSVHQTLAEGRTVTVEELDEEINRLMQSEVVNLLQPLLPANFFKNMGDFPNSVIDRQTLFRTIQAVRLTIDHMSAATVIAISILLCVHPDASIFHNTLYDLPTENWSPGSAIFTTIMVSIGLGITYGTFNRQAWHLYHQLINDIATGTGFKNTGDAAGLIDKLKKLSTFLNTTAEELSAVQDQTFYTDAIHSLETLVDIHEYMRNQELPCHPTVLQDNPYRGTVTRETTLTNERAAECLKIGTDILREAYDKPKKQKIRVAEVKPKVRVAEVEKPMALEAEEATDEQDTEEISTPKKQMQLPVS